MANRFERYKWFVFPAFFLFLYLIAELLLSLGQFIRYKNEIKPYYVTPLLRPLVRLFVKDDYVPRTLSMYEWPWDYKTDRARPGYYPSPIDKTHPPYTINSFGLRGKNFQIPKPKGIYRILVFGGSSTFGGESPDDQTYPARLEQILRQKIGRENIEVINYGIHTKSLYWIAQQYFREAEKLQADLVIINSIRNTYFDQTQRWTHYSDIVTPQRAQMTKLHLFLSDNVLCYRALRVLIEKIQYKLTLRPLMKDVWDKNRAIIGQADEALPIFFNHQYPEVIEGIYLDATKRGTKLMMVLEPVRCLSGMENTTCMWGNFKDYVPAYYEAFRGALKKVQDKHPGMMILDPVEEMIKLANQEKDSMAVFSDEHLHLTPKGNVLFAEIIARKILAEKCIP